MSILPDIYQHPREAIEDMNKTISKYYTCTSPAQQSHMLREVYARVRDYLARNRSELQPVKMNFWVRAILVAYLLGEMQHARAWRHMARNYIAGLNDYQYQDECETLLICNIIKVLLEAGCAEECYDLIHRADQLTQGHDSKLGLKVGMHEALVHYFQARRHLITSGFSVGMVCNPLRKAESNLEMNNQVHARQFGLSNDASENRFHWLRVLIRLGSINKAKKVYDLIIQHDNNSRRRDWAAAFIRDGVAGVERYDQHTWPRIRSV